MRSQVLAWIRQDRWQALTPTQREQFPPIAPDFVLELLSPSDTLAATQAKIQEYQVNGVRLGWLIAPKLRRVELYRPGHPVETLVNPAQLQDEAILPGFSLVMDSIW